MFNFALDREWVEASPATRIPEPGEEKSRDRVLNDEELRALWLKLEEIAKHVEPEGDTESGEEKSKIQLPITPATAEAFQIQLLTAQRPGEVRLMRWADVNLDSGWWSIPGALTKNGKPHRVPLSKVAVEILTARQERAEDDAKFVFENRPRAGSIHNRGKKAAAALSRKLTFSFRAHDVRRTAATRMAPIAGDTDRKDAMTATARLLAKGGVHGVGAAAVRSNWTYSPHRGTTDRTASARWSPRSSRGSGGSVRALTQPDHRAPHRHAVGVNTICAATP